MGKKRYSIYLLWIIYQYILVYSTSSYYDWAFFNPKDPFPSRMVDWSLLY